VYRFKEGAVRRKVQIGTIDKYPTKTVATKAAEGLRLVANADRAAARATTFRALVQQYLREELPDRKSTRTFYRPWINNYIEPKWGDYTIAALVRAPFAVEQWLNDLDLSPKSKAHIRSLMRIMVNCAMRWGLLEVQQNPLGLVRVKGSSKRKKQPRILTAEQCIGIANATPEPFRTMLTVAMCLGLRVSEILGLQWGDFDWERLDITVQRAFVLGTEGEVKTVHSAGRVPLDPALVEVLFRYQRTYGVGASAADWVFPNPDTGRPWWPHQIQQQHIRKAGLKLFGMDGIGWHTFRHTYSSLLRQLGVDLKVQQELLRHADIRTTINIYTQAVPAHLRQANSSVVGLLKDSGLN
jgi:integrase